MNIDPSMIPQVPVDRIDAGVKSPSAADVDAFSAAMAARIPKPEQTAVESMQRTEAALVKKADVVSAADVRDPANMLGVQRAMLETRTDVDVLAKVTGVLSQAINKLTSMQ